MSKAREILELLKQKHSEDTFIPECKDGASCSGMLRMDAWVMKNSWANLRFIGYEIKVSRSDFLNDEKWRGYLQNCNLFYFVTSDAKIISKDELPPEAGLIVMSKTGRVLRTLKKPSFRDIEPPAMLLCYVLMWRAKIVSEHTPISQADYWKDWLEKKEENRDIGFRVSKALKEKYQREVEEVRRNQKNLESRIGQADMVLRAASSMGIEINRWSQEYGIKRKIQDAMKYMTEDRMRSFRRAKQELEEIIEQYEELNKEDES